MLYLMYIVVLVIILDKYPNQVNKTRKNNILNWPRQKDDMNSMLREWLFNTHDYKHINHNELSKKKEEESNHHIYNIYDEH